MGEELNFISSSSDEEQQQILDMTTDQTYNKLRELAVDGYMSADSQLLGEELDDTKQNFIFITYIINMIGILYNSINPILNTELIREISREIESKYTLYALRHLILHYNTNAQDFNITLINTSLFDPKSETNKNFCYMLTSLDEELTSVLSDYINKIKF